MEIFNKIRKVLVLLILIFTMQSALAESWLDSTYFYSKPGASQDTTWFDAKSGLTMRANSSTGKYDYSPDGGSTWKALGGGISEWKEFEPYEASPASMVSYLDKIYRVKGPSGFTSGMVFDRSKWVEVSASNDLSNRMADPSFEEAITSVIIAGGSGSTETTTTFDGYQSLKWTLSAETGTATATVSDSRLSGVFLEASCYVSASAAGLQFKAQVNGTDVPGLAVDIPAEAECSDDTYTTKATCEANEETWIPNFTLVGIPFFGGSTSTGFQIEATSSTTDTPIIDSCSIGTKRRVGDFASIPNEWSIVKAADNELSGGSFTIKRVGDLVTISWPLLSHAGGASDLYVTTTNGFLPEWARPTSVPLSQNYYATDISCNASIEANYEIGFYYINASTGVGSNRTNNCKGGSISYTVSDGLSHSKAVSVPFDNFTGLTGWNYYTPAFSAGFGSVTVKEARWRRVGDSLEVSIWFATGATTTGVGSITLPSGLNIDSTKVPRNSSTSMTTAHVGDYFRNAPSSGGLFGTILTATQTETDRVYIGAQYSDTQEHLIPSANVNANIGSSEAVSVRFTVPIEGWDQGRAIFQIDPCDNYSTSEVACSKRWINGKTVYQKCYSDDTARTAGTATLFNVGEGYRPVDNGGSVYTASNGEWVFGHAYTSGGTSSFQYYFIYDQDASDGNVKVRLATGTTIDGVNLCFRYIKP